MAKEYAFKKLYLGKRVFSLLQEKYLTVECTMFLDIGIVWLHDFNKTYPHVLENIKL